MKFNPENHIVGKVYDLTQENMNAMIAAFEEQKKQNAKLRGVLNDLILYAEELEKRVYRSNEKKIDHPYIRRARKARGGE
jgi:hypothetical protein